jgi:ABC-type branched-subunit amino acid transport system ATPase component
LIHYFQLSEIAHVPAGELSYGQAKRVGLVMAVAAGPELLMLDEPAAGLNSEEVAELQKDLEHLHASGLTICLIEHHMGLVMRTADRLIVLDSGEKIADGSPPERIAQDRRVIDAYLGDDVA